MLLTFRAALVFAGLLVVSSAHAQFVPLTDSTGFLSLSEEQRGAFDVNRLGVNLQNRSLMPWRMADEAALEATNWEAIHGPRVLLEREAYQLAGLPEWAARAQVRDSRSARGQLFGGVLLGAGVAALAYGAAPIFFGDQVPVAGSTTSDPNMPPIYESASARPVWMAVGGAAVLGGTVTLVSQSQRRRVRLAPLSVLVPGFGAHNSALADDIASP